MKKGSTWLPFSLPTWLILFFPFCVSVFVNRQQTKEPCAYLDTFELSKPHLWFKLVWFVTDSQKVIFKVCQAHATSRFNLGNGAQWV